MAANPLSAKTPARKGVGRRPVVLLLLLTLVFRGLVPQGYMPEVAVDGSVGVAWCGADPLNAALLQAFSEIPGGDLSWAGHQTALGTELCPYALLTLPTLPGEAVGLSAPLFSFVAPLRAITNDVYDFPHPRQGFSRAPPLLLHLLVS
ncbi:hypothetical protein [Marinobacter zhejiangensis]|uniref:DUF2946 domain-containing protein n=1 Tax=Marinobacter zhejiangensis TaxID=488535 RepID=A0A1I4MHU0_9GAMM|nr:hypothetical protein [Marinobacter zhejiangensis]SFM02587.1 hypothetical protein SAMN04487963_1087 [Marinobacter zhejiangensis]